MLKRAAIFCTALILSGISCSPPAKKNCIEQAVVLELDGKYQESIQVLDQCIGSGPNDARLFILRGRSRNKLGDYPGAISDYTLAIKLEPDNPAAYFYRGAARFSLGNDTAAILDYSYALQKKSMEGNGFMVEYAAPANAYGLHVNSDEIRFNRGISYYNTGNYVAALEDFRFAASSSFNVPDCECYIGLIFLHKKDYQTGCELLQRAWQAGNKEAGEYMENYCK